MACFFCCVMICVLALLLFVLCACVFLFVLCVCLCVCLCVWCACAFHTMKQAEMRASAASGCYEWPGYWCRAARAFSGVFSASEVFRLCVIGGGVGWMTKICSNKALIGVCVCIHVYTHTHFLSVYVFMYIYIYIYIYMLFLTQAIHAFRLVFVLSLVLDQ